MNIFELYRKTYSGIDREIWLLAIISLINRTGSMILPFLSIYLSSEKGYSLSLTGLVMMGFGLGSFFGNFLGGILSDKIGPFRLQFFSLLSSGIAYYMLLFLDSPISIALGLFFSTLLADTFRPANMASVALLSKPESRSKAVGVSRLAFNLGFTAGPALGGLIVASLGFKWIFIIDASTCILAALVFFIFFRSRLISEAQKEIYADQDNKPHISQVFRDRAFMFFMILIFIYGVVFMQYFNSVPVYLKNKLAWSEDYIGMTMALNGFLIVLIEMPFIQLLEKREIFKLMAFGAILSGLSFIILLFGNWIFLIWLATIVFTLGEVISFPFVTTLVINRSSDELRGRYMAMYGMTFSLCHIVAPAFGMFLADNFGFNTLWIVLGILMLLTSVGFMFLKKLMVRD